MVAGKLDLDRRAEAGNATEVGALENAVERLRQALVEGNGEVLKEVLHARLTYSHSNGAVWSKDELLQNISGKQRYLSISLSQQTVDVVGPVGIVRHIYDVVNNPGDGKTSSSHISVLLCWVKPTEDWQLLARSSNPIPA